MRTKARRLASPFAVIRVVRTPRLRRALADWFLGTHPGELLPSPNGRFWFMTMPLPSGRRIAGACPDPDREQKLWAACFGNDRDCLAGKRVLDVGANDGFFTIASLLCGAGSAHAVNTGDLVHGSFPANLEYASRRWGVRPQVTVGNFLDLPAEGPRYDVILFFGVLYHLENVYAALRLLGRLLAPGGTLYLETQVTRVESDLPVLEVASDSFPTTVPQIRERIAAVGDSNYLVPNPAAVKALAATYGLRADWLGPGNPYERTFGGHGRRAVFALTREEDAAPPPKG